MIRLTTNQANVLKLIRDNGPPRFPGDLARMLWPGKRDRPCGGNRGRGGSRLALDAGALLGRYRKSGLLDFQNRLTQQGRSLLDQYERHHP